MRKESKMKEEKVLKTVGGIVAGAIVARTMTAAIVGTGMMIKEIIEKKKKEKEERIREIIREELTK